jgi:putative transposase
MVEPEHPQLSIRKQARLLHINRNRLKPRVAKSDEEDQVLIRLMDELHLNLPTLGRRGMQRRLRHAHGIRAGRERIRRLMRLMGVRAIYPRPRTSTPGKGHKIYPYLLRDLEISRPNQVWCTDITYIPLGRGSCYLIAVMDWYSRKVLSWEVSTTMDVTFCLSAWHKAIATAGCAPEIMNTDQGSQFTSTAWMDTVELSGAQVSMDGKGRWIDNVFIERLWWSLKYEDIYLRSYANAREVARGVDRWFVGYNTQRPHSSLEDRTPSEVYAEPKACAA